MNFYDFKINKLNGEPLDLTQYKGKVLLLVNVASKCGLTAQYQGLQSLYNKYNFHGLEVIGFPCNQFGQQEPGSPEEIQEFCETKYDVNFTLTEKINVKGPDKHPIFDWLINNNPKINDEESCMSWNFTKFIVDTTGNIVDRIGPKMSPSLGEGTIVRLLKEANGIE